MQKELLYKFICGYTSPDESSQVIHWINTSEENRKMYLEEKRIHELTVWTLSDEKPAESWDDFRKKHNL